MDRDIVRCHCCGSTLYIDERISFDNVFLCPSCHSEETCTCDCCGERIWEDYAICDSNTVLCERCYDENYTRCYRCESIIAYSDSYEMSDEYYCARCRNLVAPHNAIQNYSYKPIPIFYGKGKRFMGVELEIDVGGNDSKKAQEILDIGNDEENDHIYIKHDGSLDEGMEIVSHPMTLDYHKQYLWSKIMKRAAEMGYRSHQTRTAGLHIHVNRTSFGDYEDVQEEAIARVLYFVEYHWNELLRFSRRSSEQIERWASRYGYEETPRKLMNKAKKSEKGRYTAVNLNNRSTIEFRLFRGTLKYNTFIATLELVDEICRCAEFMNDEQIKRISWSEFVSEIDSPELIQYLKERRLYINEIVEKQEEI